MREVGEQATSVGSGAWSCPRPLGKAIEHAYAFSH